MAEAILSLIVVNYEVTLAIANPVTALVMKKGIFNFCSEYKSEESNSESIKEILEAKSLIPEKKSKKEKVKKIKEL